MAADRTAEKAGHGDKESRMRDRAIAAILTTASLDAAATVCGVSKSTLNRWLREPAFAEALRQAGRQVLDEALAQLQALARPAVDALKRNLRCRRPGTEVQAARTVLEHATRSVELFELADRVEALEQAIRLREGGRR